MSKAAVRVDYSEGERRALDALKKSPGKALTTFELIERVYPDGKPFHARQAVVGTMKSLALKAERNREKFRVSQTRRAGARPATFKLEERV